MNETYAFIEAEKTTHGVAFLCRLLSVARSSFYAWQAAAKSRAARQAADESLAHEITVIHVASRHTYGVPRIHAELRRPGQAVNRKRVARVMRERGIQGAHRRRRRSLTQPDKKAKPAPDLVGRDFHAERPGTKLVGDITFLPTAEGWLYLALLAGPGHPRGRRIRDGRPPPCLPRRRCPEDGSWPRRPAAGMHHTLGSRQRIHVSRIPP
jgi:putative transposase